MFLEVEVDLHRVNAPDAVLLNGPLKHASVVWHHQPEIRTTRALPISKSFEEHGRRVCRQVERSYPERGEAGQGPRTGKSGSRMLDSLFRKCVPNEPQEGVPRSRRNMAPVDSMLRKLIGFAPCIEQQGGGLRVDCAPSSRTR